MSAALDREAIEALIHQRLDELLPAKIDEALAVRAANRQPSLAIIATKGTLDWAYPPFILASTAAALDWQVQVFFTFYGLGLLRHDVSDLRISPLGNPAMPMKMPFGPEGFRALEWNIPNLIQTNLPGFEAMASSLMKETMRQKGVAGIPELRALCVEAGVKLIACQMTVDLFGYRPEDFIAGIDYAGAATFLPTAQRSDVCLFI